VPHPGWSAVETPTDGRRTNVEHGDLVYAVGGFKQLLLVRWDAEDGSMFIKGTAMTTSTLISEEAVGESHDLTAPPPYTSISPFGDLSGSAQQILRPRPRKISLYVDADLLFVLLSTYGRRMARTKRTKSTFFDPNAMTWRPRGKPDYWRIYRRSMAIRFASLILELSGFGVECLL